MKRRTVFIIKCYTAVILFVITAYVITFQQGYWLNNFLAYNLRPESDVYPTIENYTALLLPEKPQTQQVSTEGFHRFLMPVEGSVVVNYNEKMGSDKKSYLLEGTILQCQPGSQVIAGDNGTIAAIRFSEEVGWYVDINHGSGIYSRYSNLTNINKKEGSKVQRGERIAKVADSFEGKFYLQIFINGKAVNPVTATLMKQGI